MSYVAVGMFVLAAARGPASGGHAAALAGKRLVMSGATCAGLEFVDSKHAVLVSEMGCVTLETRVRWLSADTFVLVEMERINESSPPRTWIYQVVKRSASSITLRQPWTGWGDLKDDVIRYAIRTGDSLEKPRPREPS